MIFVSQLQVIQGEMKQNAIALQYHSNSSKCMYKIFADWTG